MLVNPNFDLLKPVRSDEFLPPIHLWARLGGLALVGTAGIAVALIAVIPYNIVVKAPATMRPSGEIRVVQAEVEGVVNRIVVQENQAVKQGDAIAYLDDSQSQTQQRQLEGNIQQGQMQLAQIAAQANALERQQAAESSVSDRSIASAEADLSRSRRDFQDKQIAAETELQEAQANVELAQDQLKRYQQLGSAQAISKLQVKEKENAFKTALAQLQRAKSKVNPNRGAVTIAVEKIAQDNARGKVTLAKLKQERESLIGKQVELENQLNHDRQTLAQLDRDRQRTVVRATASGTILKLDLRNSGQVLHLGESVAQISPHQPVLMVKARVAAQDISQVNICKQKRPLDCQVGQAQLQISAYPYPDYGVLNGAVIAIAPDATTTNPTNPSLSYYDVTIQPERGFLVRGDRHYALQPGMEINANILSQKETVLTFLLRKARLLTDW
jgi:HlyD family type I secretion membrane fusion protein